MADPSSPASPRLKRKQKIDPKDDGAEDPVVEKPTDVKPTAASTATTTTPAVTVTPSPPTPTPPPVKKVKKQKDPEVIFACNSCDYKNTLEMVRSHKLSANHMNHMDSRKRNGTIYGLRVAIVRNDEEGDVDAEKPDGDSKVSGGGDGGPANDASDAKASAAASGKPQQQQQQKPLTFVGLDEYFYCQDSNRMKCRNCSMIFQTKAVSGHIPRCQSKKYICALCSAPFASEEEMQNHKKENHYVCDVCGRDFLDAGDFLERHQKRCKEMKEKRENEGIVEIEAPPKTPGV